MSSEDFEQTELLLLIFLLLFDEFLNELLQLGLTGLRDQRLLEQDLINKSVDISSTERMKSAKIQIVRLSPQNSRESRVNGHFSALFG